MDFQFMEILQIIFFVQRSKGLKLHKPLVLQRYRTNHVTYGLSLIKITSITISKIIKSCMHNIIVHTENPLISMLEGQPEINRKWFKKNIIQFANFCFRVRISLTTRFKVKTSNVLIFRPVCALEVVLKWLSVQTGLFLSFGMKTFSTKPVLLQVLILSGSKWRSSRRTLNCSLNRSTSFQPKKMPFGPKVLAQT